MNKDRLKGKWKQVSGEARSKWGKLTDDDLARAEGDAQKLSGFVQERYGVTKEEADKRVKSWTESMND